MMLRLRRFAFLAVALTASATGTASAAKFNKVLDVGQPAPAWKDLAGTDGKSHSLADHKDAKVLVVIFTCNHCPVAQAYEERLKSIVKDYGKKGVELVAINVNTSDADKLEAMKKHAAEREFNFDYLYDPSQKIGRAFGANVTPHAFVLDKDRKIAYMGAIDNSMDPAKVESTYLLDAIDALLAGEKPEITEMRQFGCGIQYNPE